MTLNKLFLIVSLLTYLSLQTTIIPDVANPLVMNPPQGPLEAALPSLTLKFSLQKENSYAVGVNKFASVGARYFQYLGVAFPTFTDLAFDTQVNNAAPYTCALLDSNGAKIAVEAEVGRSSTITTMIPAEKHIAFCKIIEQVTTTSPLVKGEMYALTITFTNTNMKFSNSFMRAVSLFTATSNHPERIIIDSLPVFGNLGLYNDYRVSTNSKIFQIDSPTIVVSDNTRIIKPVTTFSVSMTFTAKDYVPLGTHKIVFRYNSKHFSETPLPSITVDRADPNSNSPTTAALSGTISAKAFYAPSGYFAVSLEGSEEELVPDRKFIITLSGIKAKEAVNSDTFLEVLVYYTNTYSIIFYSKVIQLPMTQINLNFSEAAHPDGYDVYSSGAWPMKFKFSSPVNISPGYVMLRHSNWVAYSSTGGGNILTFIAPTCDFSATTSIPSGFSERPSCYPLSNLPEPITGTGNYGSGIFFRLPQIQAGVDYSFTVWAFFDTCGGFPQAAGAFGIEGQAYTRPSFNLKIYSDIDVTKIGLNRFYDDTSSYLIASSINKSFNQICWNNKIGSIYQILLEYGPEDYSGTNIPCSPSNQPARLLNGEFTPQEQLLMREITDWKTYNLAEENSLTLQPELSNVVTSDINNERWVYGSSTSTSLISNSFVFIKSWLPYSGEEPPCSLYPVPMFYPPGSMKGCFTPRGRVIVQMQTSIPWFKESSKNFKSPADANSTSGCILNWRGGFPNEVRTMEISADQKASPPSHWIGTGRYPYKTLLRSNAYPNQFDQASTYSRIISEEHSGNYADRGWVFGYDLTELTDQRRLQSLPEVPRYGFGFLTSCTSWASPPVITSIYASLDIQIIWQSYYEVYKPTKVMRFVKLYPEGGVLQETSSTKRKSQANSQPYTNHLAYTSVTDDQSVCLLELAANFATNYNNNGNTLAIWLSFSSLLESDYADPAASYPAAPLVTGQKVYGLSSQYTMSIANQYNYLEADKVLVNENNNGRLLGNQVPLTNISLMIATIYSLANAGSRYMFYMGSLILITGSSTFSDKGNILIPYYCPVYPHVIPLVKYNSNVSTFIASFLKMNYFTSITEVSSFVLGKDNNAVQSAGFKYSNVGLSFTGKSLGLKQDAVIRFEKSTVNSNVIYIWNYSATKTNTAINCTGHSLFFSAGVNFEPSLTSTMASQVSAFSMPTGKRFFILGKPFSNALLAANTSVVSMAVSGTGIDSISQSITGIIRPDITFYVNSAGNLQTTDKIAYFCESSVIGETGESTLNTSILTNYQTDLKKFMLDFYPDESSTFSMPLTLERPNEKYDNDPAGSLSLNFGPPKPVPAGANLIFASSSFNAATICGVTVSGQIATACIYINTEMTCPLKESTPSYSICCYNVAFSSQLTSLLSLNIEYPLDPAVIATDSKNIFQNYVSSSLYTYSDTSSVTANNNGSIVLSDAKISEIKYSTLAAQEDAYGKVTFKVSLGREAFRGMKVIISSDSFSKLLIDSTKILPRCFASFKEIQNGEVLDEDIFIDGCSIAQLSSSIVVTTKSIPYKCGIQMPKYLYVTLWPVVVYNFPALSSNLHKVTITMADSTTNAAKNSGTFTAFPSISIPFSTTKPLVTRNDLCTLKIYPKIPGDPGDYTFTFNLENTVEHSVLIDEVLIYWPDAYYGQLIPNIYCTVGGVIAGCYFVEENVLAIRFNSGALPMSGKTDVVVYGVMNPHTSATTLEDLYFICQVSTYSNTANRVILMQGTHKYAGGIPMIAEAQKGNLKFLNVKTPLSKTNPREIATHVFKIAFDNISGGSSLPITSASTPILHIYLPPDYMLWQYNLQPTAAIEEYAWDSVTKTIAKPIIQPSIKTTVISGNRITLTLDASKYTFSNDFRYWQITLYQIMLPIDAVATRLNRITLTNADGNLFYSTFTNLNNYWSEYLTKIPENSPLVYNRGNTPVNDNSKWFIDIDIANAFLVKPGRYSKTYFKVKRNTKINPTPASTTVALTNEKLFSTTQSSYQVSSSVYEPIYFYIGCPCDTHTGYYTVNFSSSDPLFAPMAPVTMAVGEQDKLKIIMTSTSTAIPTASSMWIGYYLADINVDVINIAWTADSENIDTTATISSVVIPAGTYTRTTKKMSHVFSLFRSQGETSGNLKFTLVNLGNNCYTIDSPISVTTSTTIESNTNTNKNGRILKELIIKYTNADDANVTNLDKNSVRFTISPVFTPAFIYCALFCSNITPPTEADMIFTTYDSATKPSNTANTELIQYYYNYFPPTSSDVSYDMDFTGLVRGMNYKLKCILTGTKNNNSTSISQIIESDPTNSSRLISPAATKATSCIQFNFTNAPAGTTIIEMVNYCQAYFSSGAGWSKNGCIICIDSDSGYTVPGLSLPKIVCASPTKSRLRFLQSLDDSAISSLCAVPHSQCETDPQFDSKESPYAINSLSKELNSSSLIATKLYTNVDLNSSLVDPQPAVPDMSKFFTFLTSVNKNGMATWISFYTLGNVKCYWQIAPTGTPLHASLLESCTDTSRCGWFVATKSTSTFSTSSSSLKAFTPGNYELNIACISTIIGATQNSVMKSYEFTIENPNPPCINGVNCTNTTGSAYLSFSLIALMILMIMSLLF